MKEMEADYTAMERNILSELSFLLAFDLARLPIHKLNISLFGVRFFTPDITSICYFIIQL